MRSVLVDHSALNHIRAIEGIFENAFELSGVKPPNVEIAFYGSLLQSGADRFILIPSSIDSHASHSTRSLPDTRFKIVENRKFRDISQLAWDSLFGAALKGGDSIHIVSLVFFFEALAKAVQTKSSLVFCSQLPSPKELARSFRANAAMSIQNFLSSMVSTAPQLPVHAREVCVRDFQILKELLEAQIYESYVASHRSFEDSGSEVRLASEGVSMVAASIQRRLRPSFSLRRGLIRLIPVSVATIDTLFGKLPGRLAEFFGDILGDWVKEERRLVIYDHSKLQTELYNRWSEEAFGSD